MDDSQHSQKLNTEAGKMFHEFKYNSIVETVRLLEKGVTFYFAIVAATVGYVFSANLSVKQVEAILIGASCVSALFAIIMLSISYGVVRGLYDLKYGMKKVDATTFKIMGMETYFRRGIIVTIIVATCCFLILILLTVGLLLKIP